MRNSTNTILFGLFITTIISCTQNGNNKTSSELTISINKNADTNSIKKFEDRYSIVGDFNGDKMVDTVFESYISSLTNKETYKKQNTVDWEKNIDLIVKKLPVTRLYASIPTVDTFIVTKEAQQIGLFHFRNLGDLNEDGKDEIGYAINWLDNSNLNHYHIVSIIDNKFKEIFSFEINEMFCYEGSEGLFDNKEFIQKIGNKTIKYKFYSDSATNNTGEFKFSK
jgi:hypothetical protein